MQPRLSGMDNPKMILQPSPTNTNSGSNNSGTESGSPSPSSFSHKISGMVATSRYHLDTLSTGMHPVALDAYHAKLGGMEVRKVKMQTTDSGSPSPTPFNHKVPGIPCVAAASRYTAPVHIDVGGVIYTSSLETLTKDPDSRLAQMFSGGIPIVLDSLKQHYFIDRDGKSFRHILNYLRTNKLTISNDYDEFEIIYEEAKFYDITGMIKTMDAIRKEKNKSRLVTTDDSGSFKRKHASHNDNNFKDNMKNSVNHSTNDIHPNKRCRTRYNSDESSGSFDEPGFDVIALNIAPDLGERVMLSGERSVIEEVFPEISQALMDARSGVAWNHDMRYIVRFPLNGYSKVTSLQAINRLMNCNFKVEAATGGGVEGQQFTEYIFTRKSNVP
ncbi:KCTD15 (predicted) [Pycnogonum litorale]